MDSIYRCKVCGMTVHGNCRERAKGIFKCVPPKESKQHEPEEDLGEKFMRTIKKGGSPIYNQPIGYLYASAVCLMGRTLCINQITLFNLKNKHKTLYLLLSCDVESASSIYSSKSNSPPPPLTTIRLSI